MLAITGLRHAAEIVDDRDLRMKAPAAIPDGPTGGIITGLQVSDNDTRSAGWDENIACFSVCGR